VQKDKDFDVIVMGPIKTVPKEWDTWSRIQIRGPMTLKQLIDEISTRYGFVISTMRIQNVDVYIGFIPKLQY
jgi:hypothetical protein